MEDVAINDQERIEALKAYFEKRDDVVMAFLFGSRSKEQTRPSSDWDIAVYFKTDNHAVEWEESEKEYAQENEVWNDCIKLLNTDSVDLVVLNRAPAHLADIAIKGIPLSIKDGRLFTEFMLIISSQAIDYREMVNDYYAISERSNSLSGEDRTILQKTIRFFDEQIVLFGDFATMSGDEYSNDVHKRNDVERWIENMINATIDMSKTVLASQKKKIPDSYREILEKACLGLGVSKEVSVKIENWVKLRNILAHEYLDIKWKRIEGFIKEGKKCFEEFILAVKKFEKEN